MLTRPNQVSACDGEQMEIHCKLDYIIEVITAHQTLLGGGGNGGASSGAPPPPPSHVQPDAARAAPDGPLLSSGNQQNKVCQAASGGGLAIGATRAAGADNYELHAAGAGSGQADCDEQTRAKVAKEGQPRLLALVRNECHLRNSCKLNLGATALPATAISGELSGTITTTQPPPTGNATDQSKQLAKLLGASCAANRKLVEVAYRCRPTRVLRRNVCKNAQLNLECPEEKRLAIASAAYGFWPEDRRTHEKCAELAARNGGQQTELAAAAQQQQPPQTQPPLSLNRSCASTSSTSALTVLSSECLFKQHCQLQVNQTLFGETNCSREQQPLEYLRLMYICMDDSALNYNATGFQQQLQRRQQLQSQLDAHFQGQQNVGSASLLSAAAAASTAAPTIQNDPPFGQKREANQNVPNQIKKSGPALFTNGGGGGASQAAADDEVQASPSTDDEDEVGAGRVLPIYPHPRRPAESSAGANEKLEKRLKLYLIRYQTQATLLGLVSLTLLMFALTIRVCRRTKSARNSTASSKGSSTSTSSSSSAGAKSLSSYLTSSSSSGCAGNQQAATGAPCKPLSFGAQRNQPLKQLNSCSESCFSLEDYNGYFNESSAPRETFSESPAAALQPPQGSLTPLGSQQQQDAQLAPPPQPASAGYFTGGTARPKFWSFYGHEQNATGSLRLANSAAPFNQQPPNYLQAAGGGGATTQRSFAGQQAHLQPQATQQLYQHNHLPQRNFVLAPAAPQLPHQHQPQQQLCAAHSAEQQLGVADQHQFALLALNPAELQLAAGNAQQQQTCAFHQQQQRQLLLAPAGAAYDLPPPPQASQQDVIAQAVPPR